MREGAPRVPAKSEQPPEPVIVRYAWSDVLKWEEQNKEYPHRNLVRLLLGGTNNTGREVVAVEPLHVGGKGVLVEDGIVASELSGDILTAKGIGSCVFLAGFKDGRGFLVHHMPGSAMHDSFITLFKRYGLARGDAGVRLVVGGGLKQEGGLGNRQSGSGRKAPIAAAQKHQLYIADIGMRSDPSSNKWDSTSVAVDPRSALVVVVAADASPEEAKDVSEAPVHNQNDVKRFYNAL